MNIDVQHLAKHASLTIEDEEMQQRELQELVLQMDALPEVLAVLHSAERTMHLREDSVTPSLPREDILRNAPKTEDGYFVVPQ